jgi:porphobilinogen synthase
MTVARFPLARPRRLRADPWRRALVQENALSASDLIWPCFVIEGEDRAEPIASLPGVERLTIDRLVEAAAEAAKLGIPCMALFPKLDDKLKTPGCEEAWNPETLVARATRAVKNAVPKMGILLDVALDPYSSLGHDGLVIGGRVDNDRSLEALVRQGRVLAEAGADILGPSDMMDGRVRALRDMLEGDQFVDTMIMSYAVKYASSFYGPFRDAVGAAGKLGTGDAPGDKRTYQMNPANTDEALREVEMDLDEGADMVMVKPGLPYLDVCRRVKERFSVPTFAYMVSGEYAMIEAAAANGWLDRRQAALEVLLGFKRAGCDGILSYHARDAARWLAEG